MAQKSIDELVIQISLNAKQLQQSLNNAEKSVSQFADKITGTMAIALEAIAVKFSFTFAKSLVENFASTGAKLHFLSQQVGESAQTLDKWGVAVQKSGGSADSFFNTINNLHNKLVDMKYNGDLQTAGIFGMMGITTDKANGQLKKTSEILLEISKFFQTQTTEQQQFFGRRLGLDDATIRLLGQGEEATKKIVKAQNELWNDKTANDAAKQRDKLIEVDRAFEKLKITIAEKLLPYADKFIDWMIKFVNEHGDQVADVIEEIVEGLSNFCKWLGEATDNVKSFAKELGITNEDLVKILATLVAIKALKDVFTILTTGMSAFGIASKSALLPLTVIGGTVSWIYDQYQEFKKDPASFDIDNHDLTNWKGKIGRTFLMGEEAGSALFDTVNWFKGDANKELLLDKMGSKLTDDDKLLKLAQAYTESANGKDKIGYKMKKDAYGKYQYALDGKGNKVPEAYGKYHIMPKTAQEVMGGTVTPDMLMNDAYSEKVRDKLIDKWTKQFGSKEAAYAYYNAGNPGVETFKKTGTTDYLKKLKTQTQALLAKEAKDQLAVKSIGQGGNTNNSNTNITIQNMETNAKNHEQLITDIMDNAQVSNRANTALPFNQNNRIG